MNKKNVEILAPVGSKEALISAINHGADAIYLGGKSFGARAYANNFENEDIVEAIKYAHRLGVLVYVTVNTLIKDSEFNEVLLFVKFLYENNVDAVIIQDLGLLRVIKDLFPDLVIHVSTQMNVHSVTQAKTLLNLGVKRIVLARETPLAVVKEICQLEGLEVEVFVHGALCVSYSGNCYLSSLIGKRSGNRGRCAQPCRKLYEIEGANNRQYLLSTKDLMTLDNLNDIIAAGVTSLKIEGRMKRPEYVGLVVKTYKDAISQKVDINAKKNLALMFNREFTKGYINNESNREITNVKSPNHIGVEIGKVIKVERNLAYIKLNENLNNNDSIRILSQEVDAITINGINVNNQIVARANAGDIVRVRTHHLVDVGSLVLKTTDAALIDSINSVKKKQIAVFGELFIENNHLGLSVSDGVNEVRVTSHMEVSPASSENIISRIKEQVLKTSNTNYYFEKLEADIPNVFLPIKEINEIRRIALEELDELRCSRRKVNFGDYHKYTKSINNESKLFVKVRTESQLQQVISLGVKDIIVEKKELLKYQTDDLNIYYLGLRIDYTNDDYDGASSLNFNGQRQFNSPYLNIFNAYAVNFMHEQGFKIVTLSLELSRDDIKTLINNYHNLYGVSPNLMVMAYGYYEVMITKHCLLNKSLGLEKMGCNACYKQQYYLKDELNYRFPLVNDGACNLKILNDKPVVLIDYLQELKNFGVNNFLLDLSIEENIEEIVTAYIAAFNNQKYQLNIDATLGHYKEGVM